MTSITKTAIDQLFHPMLSIDDAFSRDRNFRRKDVCHVNKTT